MTDQVAVGGGAVLIGDVVGSRRHDDRTALQRRLVEALDRANDSDQVVQPLQPTVGDEFQGAASSLAAALRLSLRVRLDLLPDVELRIGLGLGPYAVFDPASRPVSQDGPAWWAARRAIEQAAGEGARPAGRHVRCRLVALSAAEQPPTPDTARLTAAVNAFLGLQDFVLWSMSPRHHRLLTGLLDGEQQRTLARREGISQSGVSQALQSSGAQAVVQALAAIAPQNQQEAEFRSG